MTEWRKSFPKMNEPIVLDENKLLSALGMCARARKLISGAPMVCDALRSDGANAPRIVFEAADTSENTHKRISDRCGYYKVRLVRLKVDGAALGAAIGKTSFVAAVAVADDQLCRLTEQYVQFSLTQNSMK